MGLMIKMYLFNLLLLVTVKTGKSWYFCFKSMVFLKLTDRNSVCVKCG
jgi:hypothetical protein